MKLYIPSHLRKIKIVDQLVRMLSEYGSGEVEGKSYVDNSGNPLDDYRSYISQGPVKKFLSWIEASAVNDEGMDYDSLIAYLTRRFYSLKGTIKVLTDLKKYLLDGMTFEYSINHLKINIPGDSKYIKVSKNPELFRSDLYDFLGELLYFSSNQSEIDALEINILNDVSVSVCANFIPINKIEIDN